MILTKVVKHNLNLSSELAKAKQIAEFAINNRDKLSSKYVKYIGLKSAIANQILRKYGRNKKCKTVTKVNLIIPNQSIKIKENKIIIVPLKLEISLEYFPTFDKVNQIEISSDRIHISFCVSEVQNQTVQTYVGVDRNATGHIAVLADSSNGKVLKLGKLASHFRRKYAKRKKCSRFMKDLDHKISRRIVNYAIKYNCGIALENLKNIRKSYRKRKGKGKKLNDMINSWSFYRLQQFIEYKAKLAGIPVIYVDPAYTSQKCSRCGNLGDRTKKDFKCSCGHVDHADVNAAFNIGQLAIDRDIVKRGTDTPPDLVNLEPQLL